MTDILEELDDWLKIVRGYPEDTGFAVDEAMVQRARAEIAALRAARLGEWGTRLIAKARTEALEEAAWECEEREKFLVMQGWHQPDHNTIVTCAAAIRALKDKIA